jgi:hypothetical protein
MMLHEKNLICIQKKVIYLIFWINYQKLIDDIITHLKVSN